MSRECWIMIRAVFILLSFLSPALGAEPDFYIHFSDCQSTVAYLRLTEQSLRMVKGNPLLLACNKRGDRIVCQLYFEDGDPGTKGNIAEYGVILDSPPLLHFELINGVENIGVDTVERGAALVSLIADTKFLGTKVCHGLYFTAFEFKQLTETKKDTPQHPVKRTRPITPRR
jgi:hypothetical protein